MATLPLNEPAGVLVKTTCVDFPGIVAGSFFLKGCNLRCPYCYNIELIKGKTQDLNTIQDLFAHMEKRQGILKGIVISGGEPLINPYTPIIIKKAKELGYKVKLDTNGILPDELEKILNDNELKPDFVAMDIKTSPEKYADFLCAKESKLHDDKNYFITSLNKSVKLLSELPKENREFRTVLVPPLIKEEDIKKIAEILPKDATWQFAQFQNQNCLDPTYNDIYPYSDEEVNNLINYAKSLITDSNLR